jgi:hypothetical protein
VVPIGAVVSEKIKMSKLTVNEVTQSEKLKSIILKIKNGTHKQTKNE